MAGGQLTIPTTCLTNSYQSLATLQPHCSTAIYPSALPLPDPATAVCVAAPALLAMIVYFLCRAATFRALLIWFRRC